MLSKKARKLLLPVLLCVLVAALSLEQARKEKVGVFAGEYWPKAVVTAASDNHFDVLVDFIKHFTGVNPAAIPLLVYSLGIDRDDLVWLRNNFPWAHIKEFDFTAYPDHFDINNARGEYAWKPVIVKEVLDNLASSVLWLDSGDRIADESALEDAFVRIHENGYVTTRTSGSTNDWVHPGTLSYLNATSMEFRHGMPMCNGAIVGFDKGHSNVYTSLVTPWALCANIRQCIAPEGSSRINHRQDQAVLTVLIHLTGRACDLSEGSWNPSGMVPGPLRIQLQQDMSAKISADTVRNNVCGAFHDADQQRAVSFPRMMPCDGSDLGKEVVCLHALFGNPDLHGGGRKSPILKLDLQKKPMEDKNLSFSVIMSIYNAALSIEQSLPALFASMTGVWELVITLDACYDNSFNVIERLLQSMFISSTCVRVRIIEQPTAVWETSSDNLGLSVSNPKDLYIIIQPDMIVTEEGWNERVQQYFSRDSKLFAISGRCGHSQDGDNKVGRCGADFGEPLNQSVNVSQIHARETVNRGPLVLRATYAQELGFFDEQKFYLENEDHDLNRRASERNFTVAYLPIGVHESSHLGARRKKNKSTPSDVLERESAYKSYRLQLSRQNLATE